MSQPIRAAIYARVSTDSQHAEVQLEPLRSYAKARGFREVEEFVDHGVSGRADRRPALDRLLKAARARKVDAVVCSKLDRLARSVRHLTDLASEFEALGVDLIITDQGLDTTTPSGRLLFHVVGAVAEFEADLNRERTRAGLRSAKRRGVKLGRPRVTDRRAVGRIKRLRATGKTIREIAGLVDVSIGTVQNILSE